MAQVNPPAAPSYVADPIPAPMDRRQRLHRLTKRAVDVLLGSVLSMIALPIILALALVLAVRLRAWPFFVHDRIGQYSRPFRFPKLRTLPKQTHPYMLKSGGAIVATDRFCAFLRARHLDELPQLLLVPLGRLSLVGPRPKMPDEFEPTDPGYRNARTLVPQGCTGLWQVGAHTDLVVHEIPEYDFAYLRYGSLRLDFWILWRTAVQTVTGQGVHLHAIPMWVLGHGWVHEWQLHAAGGGKFLASGHRVGRRRPTRPPVSPLGSTRTAASDNGAA